MKRFIFVTFLLLAWSNVACAEEIDPSVMAAQAVQDYEQQHRAHLRTHGAVVLAGGGSVALSHREIVFVFLGETYEDNGATEKVSVTLLLAHREIESLAWSWDRVVWRQVVPTTLRIPEAAGISETPAWEFSLSGPDPATTVAVHQEGVRQPVLVPAMTRATLHMDVSGARIDGKWAVPLDVTVRVDGVPFRLPSRTAVKGGVRGTVGFVTRWTVSTSPLPTKGGPSASTRSVGVR